MTLIRQSTGYILVHIYMLASHIHDVKLLSHHLSLFDLNPVNVETIWVQWTPAQETSFHNGSEGIVASGSCS